MLYNCTHMATMVVKGLIKSCYTLTSILYNYTTHLLILLHTLCSQNALSLALPSPPSLRPLPSHPSHFFPSLPVSSLPFLLIETILRTNSYHMMYCVYKAHCFRPCIIPVYHCSVCLHAGNRFYLRPYFLRSRGRH